MVEVDERLIQYNVRSPAEIKILLQEIISGLKRTPKISPGNRGVLVNLLNREVGDGTRYTIYQYLFGKQSSKELNDSEIWALLSWVRPFQTRDEETGKSVWRCSPRVVMELIIMCNYLLGEKNE